MKKEKHESWNKCNHYATDENGLCVRCGYNTLGISNKYKIDKMHEDKMHEDYLILITGHKTRYQTNKKNMVVILKRLVPFGMTSKC